MPRKPPPAPTPPAAVPEQQIERVPVASLTPDPANVRQHSARNLKAIKGSLLRFGQQKPIVVGHNGVVVAGNGTLEAATALGWTHIDIVRTDLEGADATAFAIADNRTAELAGWSDAELAEQLAALQNADEDLAAATGYEAGDMDALLSAAAERDSVLRQLQSGGDPRRPRADGDRPDKCADGRAMAVVTFPIESIGIVETALRGMVDADDAIRYDLRRS